MHVCLRLCVYVCVKADANLHYVFSADLFGATGPLICPTVKGTHPSDLGASDVASFYASFLQTILPE